MLTNCSSCATLGSQSGSVNGPRRVTMFWRYFLKDVSNDRQAFQADMYHLAGMDSTPSAMVWGDGTRFGVDV